MFEIGLSVFIREKKPKHFSVRTRTTLSDLIKFPVVARVHSIAKIDSSRYCWDDNAML